MNELAFNLSDRLYVGRSGANLRAFLRVIRQGETSQTDQAYYTIVGGELMASLERHPRRLVYIERLDVWSTAAGAYQFIWPTWKRCVAALGLRNMSHQAQDVAAVWLIQHDGRALDRIECGRLHDAIELCAPIWASLPGDRYGQGGITMATARKIFQQYGGIEQ